MIAAARFYTSVIFLALTIAPTADASAAVVGNYAAAATAVGKKQQLC